MAIQNLCIIQPNRSSYSETFIRAHNERLPTQVHLLHGGWFPRYKANGKRLVPAGISAALHYYPRVRIVQQVTNAILSTYLRRNRIDAVLAEYGPTGVAVMDACLAATVPLHVHFHGFDAHDHSTLDKYRADYQRMFTIAHSLIVVSHDMEAQLLALGAPAHKVFYNTYGVDTTLFDQAKPADSPPTFIAVGRFVDKKAPHLTLLAFRNVLSVCPAARLVMIGDGGLWEACKLMTQALGMTKAVQFAGVQPPSMVAEAMRSARAFVQHSITPSYGDSEGTPVGILEAGATGLPVISTYHRGIKDVVIHNLTGLLVDEGDIDKMAQYMIELVQNPAKAAELGQQARTHIRNHYTIEQSCAKLWQILSKTD